MALLSRQPSAKKVLSMRRGKAVKTSWKPHRFNANTLSTRQESGVTKWYFQNTPEASFHFLGHSVQPCCFRCCIAPKNKYWESSEGGERSVFFNASVSNCEKQNDRQRWKMEGGRRVFSRCFNVFSSSSLLPVFPRRCAH